MLTPQLILSLGATLVVDLFAGGGGASTGIEQALGRHVDIAIYGLERTITSNTQMTALQSSVFYIDTKRGGIVVNAPWRSLNASLI